MQKCMQEVEISIETAESEEEGGSRVAMRVFFGSQSLFDAQAVPKTQRRLLQTTKD